ncbi:hypothetical protein PG997_005046 [Apiospora hydei]|uniref:ADP-ribosylation factor n=1 Tax=Apiospora hydei TaxID=1337664 RepID=A0ABR1X3V8_9PEZI
MEIASSSSSSRRSVDFSDLDEQAAFDHAEKYATAEGCKNFMVEFGPNHARIAYNLEDSDIEERLGANREDEYPIRWINIWTANDEQNRALTVRLGEHYGLSRRLTSLMTRPRKKPAVSQPKGKDPGVKATRKANDVEQGLGGPDKAIRLEKLPLPGNSAKNPSSASAAGGNEDQDFFMMMKNTVNYSDIDLNPKGKNIAGFWLEDSRLTPDMKLSASVHIGCITGPSWKSRRPTCTQTRTASYPLDITVGWPCVVTVRSIPPGNTVVDTNMVTDTVISIHDQPTCEAPEGEDAWRAAEIKSMRSNTSTVLIQLSALGFKRFEDQPLAQAAVRQALQTMSHPREQGEASMLHSDMAAEGTSNLFYYLFEDYVAAVPLRICAKRLVDITRKSKTKATDIIPVLHYLSKDLRELKHLFEGYRYLISKIMRTSDNNNESTNPRLSRMNTMISENDTTADYQRRLDMKNRKVFLAESAMNRFDRLADRLRWLMLNTIEGYIEEINALSNTYFNLTQQKDSSATARLTRSATLLAKLSVFFLPISFITSYFSIQIEDLYKWWNGNTYWYTFAVVATISFLSLFFFSRLLMFFSDILDEWAEAISGWPRALWNKVLNRKNDEEDGQDD